MTQNPARHSAGTPQGGRFARTAHGEPTISLDDIDWARRVTGTAAATNPRYDAVMAEVFAAASTVVDPAAKPEPAKPGTAQQAILPEGTAASVWSRNGTTAGTVSGAVDGDGMYWFEPGDGSEPYRAFLHTLTLGPEAGVTTEHRAAEVSFLAREIEDARRTRFTGTQAVLTAEVPSAVIELIGSLRTHETALHGIIDEAVSDAETARVLLEDLRDFEDPLVQEHAAASLRSGQRLVAALGYDRWPSALDG
jgi:hypothetical protein